MRLPVVAHPAGIEFLHDTLQRAIRHRAELVGDGRTIGSQRLQQALALIYRATPAGDTHGSLGSVRQGSQDGRAAQFVRGRGHQVVVHPEEARGLVEGAKQQAAQHQSDGMEPEFEGSDDAKIPSSAAHRPEEVRVLGGAGLEHAAGGSDHVHREKIVAGEAKPAH